MSEAEAAVYSDSMVDGVLLGGWEGKGDARSRKVWRQ